MILVVAPRIQAVFMFTTSTIFMRSRVLPTWLAISGYGAGLALLVLPTIAVPAGLVFPAWVLAVSLRLIATRRQNP